MNFEICEILLQLIAKREGKKGKGGDEKRRKWKAREKRQQQLLSNLTTGLNKSDEPMSNSSLGGYNPARQPYDDKSKY